MEHEAPDVPHRVTPPWIFGFTNLPFGVSGGFVATSMQLFLRKAGLSVEEAAGIYALCMIPAWIQFLYAPVVDLGIRRRAWLVLLSITGGLCMAGCLLVDLPQQLGLFKILVVAGNVLCGLVGACNGALVSTRIAPAERDKAAGWVNAANLGAQMLGGGVVMTLARVYSLHVAAVAMGLMIILPSFVALLIHEPPPLREPLLPHLKLTVKDVWAAVKARRGWTGLLFCLSPVGTVILVNLFSGWGPDFHVSDQLIEYLNGYAGGAVQAATCVGCGYLLSRINRRAAYLASGVLTAVCAMAMALGPPTVATYVVGCTAYMIVSGLAYTAFSAVVYEIVGTAGKTAATLYSVFPAAGNFAIWYATLFDAYGGSFAKDHKWREVSGVIWADALANIAGVIFLIVMLQVLFKERVPEPEASDVLSPEVA